MDIVQLVGLGIVVALLVLVIKEKSPLFALMLGIFASVYIFFSLISQMQAVLLMLEKLALNAHVKPIYLSTILKIVGIAYIAEFGAQIVRDAGQAALASKIELGGKVMILLMAVPILTVIIETVLAMLPT
ncbi:stage III sporulation protein AD [Aureibacillus halotolerans]|uniref:Stage III sporulation protein AD n=1 Tax=Aureibacillus halotolerans TaxID=1508390 RepID=A0A4R6U9J5_9BACI|nr:stage III sporulation protein AD [Aureibacillus halotolerans]TDQ41653.1 stage III sporulation protein AD [Aureibacillus halotolerans]